MASPSLISETKTPVTDFFRAVVTNLSNTDCIEWARANLTENQRAIFSRSCFGWVLDIRDFVFPGRMVHSVLFREIKTTGLEKEMWFVIHGNRLILSFFFFFIIVVF
jgi:hypothetical protein